MTLFNTFKSDLDEVVFEQRNKSYGAYAIRKAYYNHVNHGMVLTIAPMVLMVLGSIAWNYFHPVSIIPKSIKPVIIDAKPIDDGPIRLTNIEIIMPAVSSAVESLNPIYKIVRDKMVQNTTTKPDVIKPIEGIKVGSGANDLQLTLPVIGNSGNIGGGGIISGTGKTNTIMDWVADMPQFPGGQDAMYDFIRQNIQYPKVALENGISGKVMLSFVIMPDGSIDMTHIEKGIGFGCDDEAIRVIKEMPTWIPGSQNGNKVAVRLLLPIHFQTSQ